MANKKVQRKGPGRPASNLIWKGASVRFLEAEKRRLDKVARSTSVSGAEIIRAGTMRLVEQVERDGKIELTAR